MKPKLFTFLFIIFILPDLLKNPNGSTALTPIWTSIDSMPLSFIPNLGQVDKAVAFYVQGREKTIFFNARGMTLSIPFVDGEQTSQKPLQNHDPFPPLQQLAADSEKPQTELGNNRWAVMLSFVGARWVEPRGIEKIPATVSYFTGSPQDWHTGLPIYAGIRYEQLWSGIDLVYHGTSSELKYEFQLQPGANPADIQLAYRGAEIKLDASGSLQVITPAGSYLDHVPYAYQQVGGRERRVDVGYRILPGNTYGFVLGDYDPGLPLIIDPALLIHCGYIGGDAYDSAYGVDVDSEGNVYIAGITSSSQVTFPVKAGPYLTLNGGLDAFISKVNPDGSGLVYAGYIGGIEDDFATAVAVSPDGFAYISGETSSYETSFPVKTGPDLTFNGSTDAFAAKINQDGTGLVYAGYIGGNSNDSSWAIALNTSGNAYLTGYTESTQASFPVVGGPDLNHNGKSDVFVAKIKADGSGLHYAGYIGGSENETGYGIAVDSTGSAYLTGLTFSTETTFPVAVGPDLTYNGNEDAFVARVYPDGSGLDYCGYVGGSEWDWAWDIALDASGNVYLAGYTESDQTTFPVAVGPDLTYNGWFDAFVAKVKVDGSSLDYAGYIGGWGDDYGLGIDVDDSGSAYLSGYTESSQASFPVLGGPDLTHNGGFDAFISRIRADGSGLLYSGFIGGSNDDFAWDLTVGQDRDVYLVGETLSTESSFPVLGGPDLTYNGAYDAFLARVTYQVFSLHLPLILR